jgi:hypothetical protein
VFNHHPQTPEPLTEVRVGPCGRTRAVCGSPRWCNQGDSRCIAEMLGTIDPDMRHVDNGTDGDPTERYYDRPGNDIYAEENL